VLIDTFAAMNIRNIYMKRCIELALNGLGNVAPNPLVGCVIVYEDKIIGEGFHQRFGESHAEVNAINSVIKKYGEEKAAQLFHKSVLYVNLEPCSHYGKTPPCADLIIKNKIRHVVIGGIDTSPKIFGKGIDKLKATGCNVYQSELENDCRELNKRFFTFQEKKRPYIILKYAESKDGFIAPEKKNKNNRWISNEYSRKLTHKWRSEEQSILVGRNTAANDDPSLTVREWKGKNPLRLVIDKELKLKGKLKLFNSSSPTIIFNSIKNSEAKNIEHKKIDFDANTLKQLLKYLYRKDIQSVIVEGGTKTLQSFINKKLWDEARIFTGNNILSEGVKAPTIRGEKINETGILKDTLTIIRPFAK